MTAVVDGVGQAISDETRDSSDQTSHVLAKVAIGESPASGQGQSREGCFAHEEMIRSISSRVVARGLVAEDTPNACCGSGFDLIGVHGLARGNAEYIWFGLFEHVFIVTEGWNIAPNVPPAGNKFRSRFCARNRIHRRFQFQEWLEKPRQNCDGSNRRSNMRWQPAMGDPQYVFFSPSL